MEYKKYIYRLCTEVNYKCEESVTLALQMLATEALRYHRVSLEYEEKLKEIMTVKDFETMMAQMSREMFADEIHGMADGEFKDFCLEHMEEITL